MLPTDSIPVPRPAAWRAPRISAVRPGIALALAIAAALLVAGCTTPPALTKVVDTGASYTVSQAEQMGDATPLGKTASLTKAQGPAERQRALTQLRRSGPDGVRTADLLTRVFPASMSSVPVRIEHAQVDGSDALVVVEAAPGKSGTLTTRLVWILAYGDGRVLDSASYR